MAVTFNQKLMDFLKSHKVIKVCPVVLGGLAVPRPSAEIVDEQVINTEGRNITKEFTLVHKRLLKLSKRKILI